MRTFTGLRRYLRTLRYLRPLQVLGILQSIFTRLLPGACAGYRGKVNTAARRDLDLLPGIAGYGWQRDLSFTFLNRTKTFRGSIDWGWMGYGRLWNEQLNSLPFLTQRGLPLSRGLEFLRSFMVQPRFTSLSMNPHAVSWRIIHTIQFVTRWKAEISQEAMDLIAGFVTAQANCLRRNLEYRLLGNHLFANASALCFASLWLGDRRLFRKSERILNRQLSQQFFDDGGHVERSPMYHASVVRLILDLYNLLSHNPVPANGLAGRLKEKAEAAIRWLKGMMMSDGTLPCLNDTARGWAPRPENLLAYARSLLAELPPAGDLGDSGFRKIRRGPYEMVVSTGAVSPDYNPGHSHCDAGSFELYLHSQAVVEDTGLSSYDDPSIRLHERGTAAHNTVMVDGCEQNEIWNRFRVARRARVEMETGPELLIIRCYSFRKRKGYVHQRRFMFDEASIAIHDVVQCSKPVTCRGFIHFSPGLVPRLEGDTITIGDTILRVSGGESVRIERGYQARGFNDRRANRRVEITFPSTSALTIWITNQNSGRISG